MHGLYNLQETLHMGYYVEFPESSVEFTFYTSKIKSMDYTLVIAIFLACICFLVLFPFSQVMNKITKNIPLLGMLLDLLLHIHKIHDRATKILRKHEGTFLFKGPWFANMDMLVTVDPANVHYIMTGNFTNFPKGSEFKKIFDFLGDGIFNSDWDLWKNQRKIARMFINHRRFFRYLVNISMNKIHEGVIPILEKASQEMQVLDMQDLFQRFTFDLTCSFVTGYDPGCLSIELPEVPFSKAMDDAEEAVFYRHVLPENFLKLQRLLGIGEEAKLAKASETLNQIVGKYIDMKREELSKGVKTDQEDVEGVDLLTTYINEENIQGLRSDDKFLRDTILNFMIAGRDTTSSALSWFFWLLSKNPSVLKKIRDELVENIPKDEAKKWRIFNIDEVNKLVYLHGAICDSLRLYPPVPFQHKSPLKPDILPSGHKVFPGMKILFPLYAMGRMKFIWGDDCLEFKPERWISERGGIKHEPSYKFMAFNAGPRTCLGKEVAFTQMKLAAAAIVHNYDIQVVEGNTIEPSLSVILHMKDGLKVRVKNRWV